MYQSTFCTRCNQRQRSPAHHCQPSAIKKFQRIRQAVKAREQRASAR